MPEPTVELIREALRGVIDPELRRDVIELRMDRDITIDGGHITVGIALTTAACPLRSNIESQVRRCVGEVPGITGVEVNFGEMTEAERADLRTRLRGGRQERPVGVSLPEGCVTISISSGKGGVGKSTTTANLAAALAARGIEVGVIDADVYGHSIPRMLGIHQQPVTLDGMIVPPVAHDVRVMSIGFFLDEHEPVMWRGPMLHRALEQFLGDVHWGDTEVLIVDMPPGTGDVAISLGQLLPATGVVLVTTPQQAAQAVAARAGAMAQKFDQQILGVVENMADQPGGPSIFGRGGGDELAARFGVDLLARVPLDAAAREGSDTGTPVVLRGDSPAADAFAELADAVIARRATLQGAVAPPPEPAARIKQPLPMV